MNRVYVPRIEPVRVKTEEIAQRLINPGSMSPNFTPGTGPRIVYLDSRYEYPDDSAIEDEDAERARQTEIWQQFDSNGGIKFLDRQAEGMYGPRIVQHIRERVFNDLGTRANAEFYERVFSELFDQAMNVVAISTGIRPFDGDNYHDIGYHPQ